MIILIVSILMIGCFPFMYLCNRFDRWVNKRDVILREQDKGMKLKAERDRYFRNKKLRKCK